MSDLVFDALRAAQMKLADFVFSKAATRRRPNRIAEIHELRRNLLSTAKTAHLSFDTWRELLRTVYRAGCELEVLGEKTELKSPDIELARKMCPLKQQVIQRVLENHEWE